MFKLQCEKCGASSIITFVTGGLDAKDNCSLNFDGKVVFRVVDFDGQTEVICNVCKNTIREVW